MAKILIVLNITLLIIASLLLVEAKCLEKEIKSAQCIPCHIWSR